MAEVTLTTIRKSFSGEEVLKGINLAIGDGEFLTLVGPSGCGKSTLLRIIAGLEDQDDGAVTIGGQPVNHLDPADRNIAMVFQSYALYPHMKAFDIIALPLRLSRLNALQRIPVLGRLSPAGRAAERQIVAEVEATSELLEIAELLARRPAEMSGGQRQRVALGRSIVRRPDVFLFDEPLSNLDARLRNQMRSDLVQLQRRLGATFIYVTHDQTEAMTMSDRVAVMFEGAIEQLGTPAEIYGTPATLRVASFIGNPAANALPATLSGNFLRAGELRIPVSHQGGAEGAVTIAFRPEAARFGGGGGSGAVIAGEVVQVEDYGSDRCVHLRVPAAEAQIIVRTTERGAIAIGTGVTISIDLSEMHFFGADGCRRADIVPLPVAACEVRA